MTRVAAVDCGTNTVRLLIVEVLPPDPPRELLRRDRIVRLGEGVDARGRLSEEALGRLDACLEDYADELRAHGVDTVMCCATSAARDADNTDDLRAVVSARLGVTPQVLTGAQEAALSLLGVTRAPTRPLAPLAEPVLVVDVGGGSTELTLGTVSGAVEAAVSLDVGSVRLTERCLTGDPPTPGEVATASRLVDGALDSHASALDLSRAAAVVAVSGTGLTVGVHAAGGAAGAGESDDVRPLLASIDGVDLALPAVRAAARDLLSRPVAARAALPYVPPGRADVLGGGALVLDRVLARTRVQVVRLSVADILDGILVRALADLR